jgi:hypothetical protein
MWRSRIPKLIGGKDLKAIWDGRKTLAWEIFFHRDKGFYRMKMKIVKQGFIYGLGGDIICCIANQTTLFKLTPIIHQQ